MARKGRRAIRAWHFAHPDRQRAFCAVVTTEAGNISEACRRLGVSYGAVADLRIADAGFRAALEDAIKRGADRLEDEAKRRAYNGVKRTIYHKGRGIAERVEYSDQLLMFLLRGHMPEKYRDKQDVNVKMNVLFSSLDATQLSMAELEEIAAGKITDELLEKVARLTLENKEAIPGEVLGSESSAAGDEGSPASEQQSVSG